MVDDTRVVKRYAGARLFDSAALAYVTVEQLRSLRRCEGPVVVIEDAETGEDVTASVLEG